MSAGGRKGMANRYGQAPAPAPAAAPDSTRPPDPPPVRSGSTLAEQMAEQCEWLQRRISWGQTHGETATELTKWAGQFTNAQRHLAKLTGALEVSEGQILKSPKFARALQVIREAIGDDLPVWERITKALAEYEGGETG